jgi:hypothetical protein
VRIRPGETTQVAAITRPGAGDEEAHFLLR